MFRCCTVVCALGAALYTGTLAASVEFASGTVDVSGETTCSTSFVVSTASPGIDALLRRQKPGLVESSHQKPLLPAQLALWQLYKRDIAPALTKKFPDFPGNLLNNPEQHRQHKIIGLLTKGRLETSAGISAIKDGPRFSDLLDKIHSILKYEAEIQDALKLAETLATSRLKSSAGETLTQYQELLQTTATIPLVLYPQPIIVQLATVPKSVSRAEAFQKLLDLGILENKRFMAWFLDHLADNGKIQNIDLELALASSTPVSFSRYRHLIADLSANEDAPSSVFATLLLMTRVGATPLLTERFSRQIVKQPNLARSDAVLWLGMLGYVRKDLSSFLLSAPQPANDPQLRLGIALVGSSSHLIAANANELRLIVRDAAAQPSTRDLASETLQKNPSILTPEDVDLIIDPRRTILPNAYARIAALVTPEKAGLLFFNLLAKTSAALSSEADYYKAALAAITPILLERAEIVEYIERGNLTIGPTNYNDELIQIIEQHKSGSPLTDLAALILAAKENAHPRELMAVIHYTARATTSATKYNPRIKKALLTRQRPESIIALAINSGQPAKHFDYVVTYVGSVALDEATAEAYALGFISQIRKIPGRRRLFVDQVAAFSKRFGLWETLLTRALSEDTTPTARTDAAIFIHAAEGSHRSHESKLIAQKAYQANDEMALDLLNPKNFTAPVKSQPSAAKTEAQPAAVSKEPKPVVDLRHAVAINDVRLIREELKKTYFARKILDDKLALELTSHAEHDDELVELLAHHTSVQQNTAALTASSPHTVMAAIKVLEKRLDDIAKLGRASNVPHILKTLEERLSGAGDRRTSVKERLGQLLIALLAKIDFNLDKAGFRHAFAAYAFYTEYCKPPITRESIDFIFQWMTKVTPDHGPRFYDILHANLLHPRLEPTSVDLKRVSNAFKVWQSMDADPVHQAILGAALFGLQGFQSDDIRESMANGIAALSDDHWLRSFLEQKLADRSPYRLSTVDLGLQTPDTDYEHFLRQPHDFAALIKDDLRKLSILRHARSESDDSKEMKKVREIISMAVAFNDALRAGWLPIDVSKDQSRGYDILSINLRTGEKRFIEVKSKWANWDNIFITYRQLETSLIMQEAASGDYFIHLVEFNPESSLYASLFYLNPTRSYLEEHHLPTNVNFSYPPFKRNGLEHFRVNSPY